MESKNIKLPCLSKRDLVSIGFPGCSLGPLGTNGSVVQVETVRIVLASNKARSCCKVCFPLLAGVGQLCKKE